MFAHAAVDQYDDINKELLQDMPKLVSDTEFFFEPLLAQLLVNQSKYFTALQQHAVQLANSTQYVFFFSLCSTLLIALACPMRTCRKSER